GARRARLPAPDPADAERAGVRPGGAGPAGLARAPDRDLGAALDLPGAGEVAHVQREREPAAAVPIQERGALGDVAERRHVGDLAGVAALRADQDALPVRDAELLQPGGGEVGPHVAERLVDRDHVAAQDAALAARLRALEADPVLHR